MDPPYPDRCTRPPGPRRAPKAKRHKSSGPTVVSGPWVGAVQQPLEQREIDALLDKIAQSGLDSLTPHERRRLDEVQPPLARRTRGLKVRAPSLPSASRRRLVRGRDKLYGLSERSETAPKRRRNVY